jgi:citrate lyase subunit beta/citryl-CoA lyase
MARQGIACRSWLFVPGDSPHKMERAWTSGADAVVLDLEDGVAPAQKLSSRDAVAAEIARIRARTDLPPLKIFVRINSLETVLASDDVRTTFASGPDGYVVPKVEDVAQVRRLSAQLAELERSKGVAEGRTALVPIVTETPRAVFRLAELCHADPRLTAVMWGAEDLSTAIGASRTKREDGAWLDVFRTVRSLVLLAAAGASLDVVDAPFTDLADLTRLDVESREAAVMGFTGKLAVHPDQIAVINQAFLPGETEIARAKELLQAAEAAPGGVFRFQGQMVDRPHIKAAERVLASVAARGDAK